MLLHAWLVLGLDDKFISSHFLLDVGAMRWFEVTRCGSGDLRSPPNHRFIHEMARHAPVQLVIYSYTWICPQPLLVSPQRRPAIAGGQFGLTMVFSPPALQFFLLTSLQLQPDNSIFLSHHFSSSLPNAMNLSTGSPLAISFGLSADKLKPKGSKSH